jgi:hypothetical protein
MNVFSKAKKGKRDDLGGQFFRSSYEANYARYLNFLIEHPLGSGRCVIKWEYEAETFEFKRIRKGVRFYTPDFKVYFSNGDVEYHEVKGWDYPKGITARKRMAKYYPNVKLVVIGEEFFNGLCRQHINQLIPDWE